MPKSYLESGFLLAVVAAHLFAFGAIWFGPNFDVGTTRQDLTLIVAPVTAAYFLAAVRFAIGTQFDTGLGRTTRWIYVAVVGLVTAAFLGGVLLVLIIHGWFGTGLTPDQIKIVIGAIETFMGAAFALIAEDIFRQPIKGGEGVHLAEQGPAGPATAVPPVPPAPPINPHLLPQ